MTTVGGIIKEITGLCGMRCNRSKPDFRSLGLRSGCSLLLGSKDGDDEKSKMSARSAVVLVHLLCLDISMF